MIDVGERAFSQMLAKEQFNDIESTSVLLTHLHSDHAGGLGNLALYNHFVKNIPLKIYTSEDAEYINAIKKLLEVCDIAPDWVKIESAVKLAGQFQTFDSVRYIPTKHANNQPSYGLDFTSKDGDVYYTGDSAETRQVEDFINSGRNIRQIYADMAAIDNKGVYTAHASVRDYEAIIEPKKRNLVTAMHFNNKEVAEYAKSVGFNVAKEWE